MKNTTASQVEGASRLFRILFITSLCLLTSCIRKAPITDTVSCAKKARIQELKNNGQSLASAYGLHLIQHNSHSEYDGSRFSKAIQADEELDSFEHIDKLFREIEKDKRIKKILIFSHGGLTRTNCSWDSGLQICEEIIAQSNGEIFPIGITWDSSFGSTARDRIMYERSGISYRGTQSSATRFVWGTGTRVPSYLLSGLARFPLTSSAAFENSIQNWDTGYQIFAGNRPNGGLFPVKFAFYQNLNKHFNTTGRIRNQNEQWLEGLSNQTAKLSLPRGQTTPSTPWFRTSLGRMTPSSDALLITQNVLSSPVQYATLPLVDSFGRPAWENMSKRTASLVRNDLMTIGRPEEEVKPVAYLFRKLCKRQSHLKLEVYGHSMGCMVFNEVIREINEGRLHDPKISKFVYMAAACSINDFNSTVGRYLQKHQQTKFYNLCLHPDTEVREVFQGVPLINIAIPGSLLVWIDSYYENPTTPLDRTLGSYVNAISNWRHLPHNPNITIKAFGMQYSDSQRIKHTNWRESDHEFYNAGPQKHGDFDGFHFWLPEFQEPKKPNVMPTYTRFRK